MADKAAIYAVLDPQAVSTLTAYTKSTRQTADDNSSAVSQLNDAFTGLMTNVLSVLQEVESALNQIDAAKADKPVSMNFILPTTANSWGKNGPTDYPKVIDLTDAEFKASDKIEVRISPSCMAAAAEAELCSTCVVTDGHINIFAKNVPTAQIVIQVWVTPGASTATSNFGTVNVPAAASGYQVPEGALNLLVNDGSGASAASLQFEESPAEETQKTSGPVS